MHSIPFLRSWRSLAGVLAMASGLTAQAKVLDNFDDNTKTGWTDFSFVTGFGIPSESGGQFRFEQPPAGRAIFSASQKTSDLIELKEGRTVEFRVDVVQGGGKDSFAVLGFIPKGNSPGTLQGYGFAKSSTDILITKGIGNYFVNEATALKQDNITLVLGLTVRNGNVEVNARALDKDANNAVLWEKTIVDTPAADVMRNGQDTPAGPFITGGYFTLYLYQDFDAGAPESPYRAVYDNAEVFVTESVVVDDFNDNTKTGWGDFTFVPGFGIPAESGGQFRFEQPPAGRAIFSASQKTSQLFELKEGERVTFQVDVVQGGAKDSFAVLGFIPKGSSPGTLQGYGFAKSTTDILITKGIGNYFSDEAVALKQDQISLMLEMTVRGGSVEVRARATDLEGDRAVLWEKTIVDTPAADVMQDGQDTPATPFITGGYFTLYLYQDFDAGAPEQPYRAVFDNAVVWAPPAAANLPPAIGEAQPKNFAAFLPASTPISFKATDDKDLSPDRLAVVLNGNRYTTANGLTVTGTGAARTASLGGLVANQNYNAVLEVQDSDGVKTTASLDFDTFLPGTLVVEAEDYNFDGGAFFDNPTPITEGSGPTAGSYGNQAGIQDVDFNDTRTSPSGTDSPWRNFDPVRMQRSLDQVRPKYTAAGGAAADVYDYVVGDFTAGEWMNYTRTFPPGSYEVYLRQSVVNINQAESVLEEVTSNRGQPNQTTRVIGSFLAPKNGFEYRNTPLTDGTGQQKVILRLNGVTTLRLRQVTPDGGGGSRTQNYLAFVAVPDPGTQRATVSELTPANNATVVTVEPRIQVTIQNRDTTVNTSSVTLSVNGTSVTPVVTPTGTGATVVYAYPSLPASGSVQAARLVFADSDGVRQTNDWSFTVSYLSLDPTSRVAGAGLERGIKVRVVQSPQENGLLDNSLIRAEAQLAAGSSIPRAMETNGVFAAINFSQNAPNGGGDGLIDGDLPIPGQDDALYGNDNYAMEALAYLDLPAGIVRFGVVSDDGYKVASAAKPDATTSPLEFNNGGPASETFDVVVPQAGLYPFRLVWYERGGGAHVEWFTVDRTTGARTLVNGAGGVAAYATVAAPSIELRSSTNLAGPYAPVPGAIVDTSTRTVTAPINGDVQRFYKLYGPTALRITETRIVGNQKVMRYAED